MAPRTKSRKQRAPLRRWPNVYTDRVTIPLTYAGPTGEYKASGRTFFEQFDSTRSFCVDRIAYQLFGDAKPMAAQLKLLGPESTQLNFWASPEMLFSESGIRGVFNIPQAQQHWYPSGTDSGQTLFNLSVLCFRKNETSSISGKCVLHIKLGPHEGSASCPTLSYVPSGSTALDEFSSDDDVNSFQAL